MNEEDTLSLFMKVDDSRYLFISITSIELKELTDGNIPLYDIFKGAKDKYQVTFDKDLENPNVTSVFDFLEDDLPMKDLYL